MKIDTGGKRLTDADYRVEKMRYGKKGKEKTSRPCITTTPSP